MTIEPKAPPQWMGGLTERENKEIAFALHYAENFAHGTTGHNALMLLAKLAKLLNEKEGYN